MLSNANAERILELVQTNFIGKVEVIIENNQEISLQYSSLTFLGLCLEELLQNIAPQTITFADQLPYKEFCSIMDKHFQVIHFLKLLIMF